MGGQNTRNPKPEPEKPEPEPKKPELEKPEPYFGFEPTVPEIITGNSGIRPRYPNYSKNPILKKSDLKFYLVLAILVQSAQILVASHGPRRPKPYPESSFLTVKTRNKNIFCLSHLSSLFLDLSISLCSDESVPRDGTSAPLAALPASHWPPAGRRCASTG